MGDGGVACVPSQLIMEKFSICGGKTNGNTKLNSSSKTSIKTENMNPKMKPKKFKGSELGSNNSGSSDREVSERNCSDDISNDNNKEEVEEGELGTLPLENGEFVPEKPVRRCEIKSEVEKVEFIPGKWRKDGSQDKNDWSSSKEEIEKGEFVPERWCRNDFANKTGDFFYSKARRCDTAKEKGWKSERERMSPSAKERGWRDWSPLSSREKGWKVDREWSPPSGKERGWKGDRDGMTTSSGKFSSEKELGRGVGSSQNLRRFSSRYDAEKTQKISSKIAGEEGSLKSDFINSKSHVRDYPSSNRLKRHGNDSDKGDRKYRFDYDDYSGSKSRKLSDDGSRSGFSSDHLSGRSVERSYKNVASLRNIPSERYSSRYLESSRAAHDRHNHSPHHSERPQHDRLRNNDRRDRSPAPCSKPSYDHSHLYDRSGSPYDRNHQYENSGRSPMCVEASPRSHGRNWDGRDRTPTFSERSPRDRGRYSDHGVKPGVGEKRPSHYGSRGQEGKHSLMKDSGGRESEFLVKNSPDRENMDGRDVSTERTSGCPCPEEELSQSPSLKNIELSRENGNIEELASMEEDMDICNTPPHVPSVANAVSGKWYYLDHLSVERGPSKLSDLKTLLEEGYLVSDHLIKHVDSDR